MTWWNDRWYFHCMRFRYPNATARWQIRLYDRKNERAVFTLTNRIGAGLHLQTAWRDRKLARL